jgi:CheY-like chemotaxis protein
VILVVDDVPGFREVLVDEFGDLGATVLEAENGTVAFEIIQSQRVDAVVSDIRMPGGTGLELLDNIKAINPKLPVVMLITGYSDLSVEDAYFKGAAALFSKPCDLDSLVAAICRSITSDSDRWVRAFDRSPSDFIVEMRVDSLSVAITSCVLNIGRGGMFVPLEDDISVPVDARVAFRITAKAGGHAPFEGIGICRWRRRNDDTGQPKGAGIEFQSLTSDSLRILDEVLAKLSPIVMIPKGFGC